MERTGEQKCMPEEIVGIMKSGGKFGKSGFKKLKRGQLGDLVGKVNDVLSDMKTINITETSNINNATTTFIAKKLGLRSCANRQKREENRGRRDEQNNQLMRLKNILTSWNEK